MTDNKEDRTVRKVNWSFISPFIYTLAGFLLAIFSVRMRWIWGDIIKIGPSVSMCITDPPPAGDEAMGVRIDNIAKNGFNRAFADRIGAIVPTRGGTIHRCILQSVLDNLPASEEYVRYYFGFDATRNRFLMVFRSGLMAPPAAVEGSYSGTLSGDTIFYRTGTNNENYCPDHCR